MNNVSLIEESRKFVWSQQVQYNLMFLFNYNESNTNLGGRYIGNGIYPLIPGRKSLGIAYSYRRSSVSFWADIRISNNMYGSSRVLHLVMTRLQSDQDSGLKINIPVSYYLLLTTVILYYHFTHSPIWNNSRLN